MKGFNGKIKAYISIILLVFILNAVNGHAFLSNSISSFSYSLNLQDDITTFSNLGDIDEHLYRNVINNSPRIEFYWDISNRKISYDEIVNTIMGRLMAALNRTNYQRNNLEFYKVYASGNFSKAHIEIVIAYHTTLEQENKMEEMLNEIIKEIIKDNMTDIEKIRAINDYIVLNSEYSEATKGSNQSAYTLLTEGKGVCNAYSLLAYLMLKKANIESLIITGYVNDSGERHAWNMVLIGEEWFHLDVTWNDPLPDRKGEVSYKFFLRDDAFMRQSHRWDTNHFPAAGISTYSHLEDYRSPKRIVLDGTYSHWAKEEIIKGIRMGIITDNIQENFKSNITRKEFAELVMSLYEAMGGKPVEISSNRFNDTDNIRILEANKLGIVNGISETAFSPDTYITREQIATMLNRLLKSLNINPVLTKEYRLFSDEAFISYWAKDSIQVMNKLMILNGVGNNRIDPKGNTTREQAILLVVRLYERFK